jgi:hypothetical protein
MAPGFDGDFLSSKRLSMGGFGQIFCAHKLSSNARDSKFGENQVKDAGP